MTSTLLSVPKPFPTVLRTAPRAARVVAGVVAVPVGVACLARPFVALVVLAAVTLGLCAGLAFAGAGAVARALDRPWRVSFVVRSTVILAATVAGLLEPGAVLAVLLPALPHLLFAVGAAAVVRAAWRPWAGARDRVRGVVGGAAVIATGGLVLLWPDLATYALTVLLGVALVAEGLWLMVVGRPGRSAHARRTVRRWPARLGAGTGLLVALALLAQSAAVAGAAPGLAITPPANVPTRPGTLLSADPISTGLPTGIHAWRIVYTTERTNGSPTVGSGFVAVGGNPRVPRPVVAWAHGTTGYTGRCGPSTQPDPFDAAGGSAVVTAAINAGAVLVAPDYPGLSTPGPQPYMIGRGEGQAVLDAVRASRGVPGLAVQNDAVIWGHSQGGHAALWAGLLAPMYAPDVTIAGVAALAPASDLPAVAHQNDITPGATIFLAFMLRAYADTYPDVRLNSVLKPGAETVVDALAARCLTEPAAVASLASSQLFGPLLARPIQGTVLGNRLEENVPIARMAVPVLIAQGDVDNLVTRTMQDGFVARLCGQGTAVDYRTYPGRDHIGILTAGSPALPDVVAWSIARVTGARPVSTC